MLIAFPNWPFQDAPAGERCQFTIVSELHYATILPAAVGSRSPTVARVTYPLKKPFLWISFQILLKGVLELGSRVFVCVWFWFLVFCFVFLCFLFFSGWALALVGFRVLFIIFGVFCLVIS